MLERFVIRVTILLYNQMMRGEHIGCLISDTFKEMPPSLSIAVRHPHAARAARAPRRPFPRRKRPQHFLTPKPFKYKGKFKVVPVLNQLNTMPWRRVWEWMYRSMFSWPRHRLAVSFTPLPLFPRGKSTRYPLDRSLGGPQDRSGQRVQENILALIGTRTPTPRLSNT
jgi:hypothetical protein